MRSITIDVAIIGGGPGGTEAAQWATRKGLSVAVISNSPPGGRAFWSSLLPSKIWLHTAHRWEQIRYAPFDGITTARLFNANTMPERISRTSQQQSEQLRETLQQLGIQWVNGTATLTAPGEISVEGENQAPLRVQARAVIIASGSLPRFTADIRPDMERIIAPRLMTRLRTLPRTLIMIGGGVTGTEYATVFAELGVNVTVVTDQPQLLPRLDPEVSHTVEDYFRTAKGIHIRTNTPVKSVKRNGDAVTVTLANNETLTAEMAFIAIGRVADLKFATSEILNLLAPSGTVVELHNGMATALDGVYAIGDVTGGPMMVNRARWQARMAVEQIAGQVKHPEPAALTEAVFTHPPVARIHHPVRAAAGEPCERYSLNFQGNLAARLHDMPAGKLVLSVSKKDGQILEASAFGPLAPEIIGVIQLAINHGISWSELRRIPLPHPTAAEILTAAG